MLNLKNVQIYVVILCIISLILLQVQSIRLETFYAGNRNSKEKLNKTLLVILKILYTNNIKNCFIAYGTLLGIVRENSCIDGDDDNDIMCDIRDHNKIKAVLTNNGFTFEDHGRLHNSKYILKTKETSDYSSVDFYMAKVDAHGNFKDTWNNTTWSNCYTSDTHKLIEYKWQDSVLYLPNNFITKLKNIYGDDWRIPRYSKSFKHKRERFF